MKDWHLKFHTKFWFNIVRKLKNHISNYLLQFILKKYNIPATFYITSGIVNTDIMFWVERLENSINCTAQNSLDLQSFGLGNFELHNNSSKIFALDQIKSGLQSYNRKLDEMSVSL